MFIRRITYNTLRNGVETLEGENVENLTIWSYSAANSNGSNEVYSAFKHVIWIYIIGIEFLVANGVRAN